MNIYMNICIKDICVCMHTKSLHLCLTLCNALGCSLPGSSVHGIPQARILEWVAVPFLQDIFPTQQFNQCLLRLPLLADVFFSMSAIWQVPLNTYIYVQSSRSVMSDSLRPHESQHARPPCPSPTPRVYSNSCPSSRWCHPAISSSVVPFSSCPQSLPVSESFPMSQLFAWDGQSIGVSALASILPINTQDWSLVGSPCSPRDSQESSPAPQFKILRHSAFFTVQLSHPYMLEKTLESPLDCKEIKPVNPKGNRSWIFIGRADDKVEAPLLCPPDAKNWLIGKDPDAGKDWRQKEKGTTEDEMVGWHHKLDGHEFEQALGVGDGQDSLAYCSPWGCKESNTTE